MVQIKTLWWRRYRWLYALVLILAVIVAVVMAKGVADAYHEKVAPHGTATYQTYQRAYKGDKQPDESYAQYRQDQVQLYHHSFRNSDGDLNQLHTYLPVAWQYGVIVVDIVVIVAMTVLSALLMAWDNVSGFERFIFGLGAARKQYYRLRSFGLLALAASAVLVHLGVNLVCLTWWIPSKDIALSGSTMLLMLLYSIVLALAGSMIGQLIGLVVNHWLAVGIVAVLVIGVGYAAFSNYVILLTDLLQWRSSYSLDSPLQGYWVVVIGSVLLAMAAWLWGERLFDQLSLEHSGWLRQHSTVWPSVVIVAILVIGAGIIFDERGAWSSGSLLFPAVIGIVAGAVALWHRRMQAA
ncbi:hypothetical protein [Lacticaseibacillus jixiensis]|uniref:hypothetical protein n=1 Tax=Lacticaseibacillus jixiensis TaxID=3231926 RepID=UPI0036F3D5F7